jgi:tripartite ATP-independent transporter DctP family solute receptor
MTTRRTILGAAALSGFPAILRAQGQALRFSHTDTPAGKRQLAAELFAERCATLTQGRVRVQVFHSGQLATDPKAVEQLQLGGLDFTVTGTGTYATHARPLNLTAMPFMLDSYEQGWKFYDDSAWLAATFNTLPARGLRVLSTWEAGFRSFTTKDGPLNSPADARGKKMRVFPNDMIRWIMEAIGFQPVVLPVTEVYLAIQQGTVIGQENPVDTILSQRFFEVAPFITLTQHVYSPLPLAVAERTWQRLSPADREGVMQAAKDSAAFSRREVRAAEAEQLKEMEGKGAKVIRPVIGPFRDAVQAVYTRAREQYGAEVDRVLAEAEAIRKALPSA